MKLFERFLGPNFDALLEQRNSDALVQLLEHNKPAIRERAISVLAELNDDKAVPQLVGALADNEPAVADAAVRALRLFGNRAASALGEALGHDDEVVHEGALRLLVEADPPQLQQLITTMHDGADRARIVAAGAVVDLIPRLDEEGRETGLQALRAAIGNRSPEIRSCAATALGAFSDERAANALSAQLKDGTQSVREACVAALENLGAAAAPAVLDALNDRNANARAAGALLLGRLADAIDAETRPKAVECLQRASQDREEKVRKKASDALRRLGGD